MKEREPDKEIISKGELFFLMHPHSEDIFSGYGLTTKAGSKEHLVGLLMIDRPPQHVSEWLQQVEATFGEYELVAMTAAGERGILCQMQIPPHDQPFLDRLPSDKTSAIQSSLESLLEETPNPTFLMNWDQERRAWLSQMIIPNELPDYLRDLFERTGYGCLAIDTNIGVVHVCHAADADIEGFQEKPVRAQWQLIEMPTAPLIRLQLDILDRPEAPYRFESFLNVGAEDQAQILAELASQEKLFLAFYGDDLGYRYANAIPHDEGQWQRLDEIVAQAERCWHALPIERRDFDRAKAEFMDRFL